jgi:hypothetical protein
VLGFIHERMKNALQSTVFHNRLKGRLFFCGFPQKNIDKCESIAYNICKEANLIERLVVGNVPTLQQGSLLLPFFLFIPT